MYSIKSALGLAKGKKYRAAKRARPQKRRGVWTRITHFADKLAFSWPVRQGLYRHLAAQVGNTIPVETALDNYRLRLQRRNRVSSDKIVADISRRMRDGSSLAAAMSKWIPADEVSMINSGELSGNLSNALDLLVESKRSVANVMKTAKSALTRPLIYTIAIYAFIWALGTFIIPDLEYVLPADRARGLARGMFQAAHLANSWVAFIPPVIGNIIYRLVAYSLPRWKGRYRVAAERYLPYSFYRDIEGYRWLMGFTALLGAGMPDVEILKNQYKYATPWLHERLYALWWRMDNGATLPEALLAKGKGGMPPFGFPNPDIVDDIASLSGFSDFPVRIKKVASTWAADLEEDMKEKANRFGFYAEAVMYGVITLLIVAVNAMSNQMGSFSG